MTDNRPDSGERESEAINAIIQASASLSDAITALIDAKAGCVPRSDRPSSTETKQEWRDSGSLANSLDAFADRLVRLKLAREDQSDIRSIREAARRLRTTHTGTRVGEIRPEVPMRLLVLNKAADALEEAGHGKMAINIRESALLLADLLDRLEGEPVDGWKRHIRYRREFQCACGYLGWEYRNEGMENTLVCTKCGNGRRTHQTPEEGDGP